MNPVVYLDNHATTPADPRVIEAMLPTFSRVFGNAASGQHAFGRAAFEAVEDARSQVAALIGGSAQDIVFTSGATESDNLAIKGVAEAQPDKRHIISSPTEHHAVLDCLARLGRAGYQIDFLPVDAFGQPEISALERMIRADTLLISVMSANNEVGTVAPLVEIGRIARSHDVLFHSDAAQMVGKLRIDVDEMNIDLLSISGHKLYGPKGIGALYVRRRPHVPIQPIMDGGGHERGLRSGTVNVPGCVGLGKACEIAGESMLSEMDRTVGLRQLLMKLLLEQLDDVELNGHPEMRLPGNLNVCFKGADADSLMLMVPEVAMSSGSACTSASPEPSYVLLAMGKPYDEASQSIRFGIGRFNTSEDIEFAAERVSAAVRRLRVMSEVTS